MAFGKLGSRGGFGSSGLLGGVAAYKFVNTEATAVAAAFTTPPTNARKKIIDNLVGSLKTAGIWTKLDLLYVMAAADSQAACINWIAPSGSFTALPVNSPAFAADRGFTGDGSAARLRTQYTPSINGVNFTLNDASAWIWSLTAGQVAGQDLGSASAPRVILRPRNTSDQILVDINNVAGATLTGTSTSGLGLFGAQRRGATDRRAWINGAQAAADASSSTGVANQEQWILGGNSTGFSTRQDAAAAWGASLSGLEASFYNAMLTYMQSVGAA